MATWKKIIVSGSNAELNKVNVGTNQQISSSVSNTFLSGSFSGSFEGTLKSSLANTTQPNIVGYDTATGLFSYQGTGSFTAATASFVTASNVYGPYGASSVLSASYAVTAAYAANVPATSSYALQALSASYAATSSLVNTLVVPGASQYFIPFVTNSDSGSGAKQLYISGSNFSYEPQSNTLNVPNINGTASRATNASTASYVNPLSQSVNISGSLNLALTGSASLTVEGNQFSQTYLSTAGAMVLNPGSGGVGMAGVNQYITLGYIYGQTAGTILTGSFTGSFKGDGSGLTGVPSSSYATSALSSSYASTAATANTVLLTNTGSGDYNLVLAAGSGTTGLITDTTGASYNASTNLLTVTSSYASNADLLDGLNSTVFAQTGSNTFTGAQVISSSFTVYTGSAIEFQVTNTGTKIGNIITDVHTITGSVGISGSVTATGFTGPLTGTASYASQALNASTASYVANAQTASYVLNAVSASYATSALSSSYASVAGNANSVSNAVTNNTNNYILTATGGGSINGESNLTFDGSTLTVSGNTNISGNLTVAGTASFYNQTTLEVADKFIILASGSTSLTDGGIIVASGGTGQNISGSAFFLESASTGTGGRFAIAASVHSSASAVAADEYMVSAKQASGAPSTAPTWGGSGNGFGNIYVDSGNGDIYIYS